MIGNITKYIKENWKTLGLKKAPAELLFIKTKDRGIRDPKVGTITFQVINKTLFSEELILIVRIPRYASNKEANSTIQLEYDNLRLVHAALKNSPISNNIPKAVFLETIGDSKVFGIGVLRGTSMGGTILSENLVSPMKKNLQISFNWLITLQKSLGNHRRQNIEELAYATIEKYKTLSDNTETHNNYFEGIIEKAKNAPRQDVPIYFQHTDFHAGNIFIKDGEISGVIDWEDFSMTNLPCFDVFHFIKTYLDSFYDYFSGQNNPQLMEKFMSSNQLSAILQDAIDFYFREMKIDIKLFEILLPLYLIESSSICKIPRKRADYYSWVFDILLLAKAFTLADFINSLGVFSYQNMRKKAAEKGNNELVEYCTRKINTLLKK